MRNIFKVDTMDNVGENWLIADFGVDRDNKHYILTTDRIPCSELHAFADGSKADAELVARLLNEHFAKLHAEAMQPGLPLGE